MGYVRVSTDEQAASGLGLEAQRAAIAVAAERLGLELAVVHADEGVSGSLPPLERPALASALGELGAGEVLLVAKRDRLGRDYLEVGLLERALKKKRARVVSAAGEGTESDEPSSLLQRRMMDVFAEHERDQIRKRTRDALAAKKARGERLGAPPFGYHVDGAGDLREDLEQLRALGIMQRMRAEGASLRAICARLVRDELKPRSGKAWHAASVRSILATAERRARR